MQTNHILSQIKSPLVALLSLASLLIALSAFSDTRYVSISKSVQAATPLKAIDPINNQTKAALSTKAASSVDKISDSLSQEALKVSPEKKSAALKKQTNRPIFDQNSASSYGQELGCLAMNIYQEARGEPDKGKFAVAAVTMNRVKNKYYPSTICGVVWQPKQFSWTNLRKKYHVIKNTRAWEKALIIAQRFIDGDDWTGVGKATHYHATTVSPNWKNEDNLIAQVGNHLFYAL